MNFIRDFYTGLTGYAGAADLIRKHQPWQFFLIPGIINLLLFILIFYTAWTYSSGIAEYLITYIEQYNVEISYPGFLRYLVRIAVNICLFFIYLKIYKYIVLILMSPILAYMAERTQELATGTSIPFSMGMYLKNIARGLKVSLRNFVFEVPTTIFLFFMSFIPGIGIVAAFLLVYFEAYYWGFAMVDYRNEYYGLNSNQSILQIRLHKGLAVANGLVFLLLLAIPVVGLLIAPALSVMAAGLAANKVYGLQASTLKTNDL
jgi:CysZ protein